MAVSIVSYNHFLVGLLAIAVLLFTSETYGDDSDKDVCSLWSNMAKSWSGDGKIQNCTNIKTSECQRVDCSGTTTFSHPLIPGSLSKLIEIDYCFGTQLNSCNNPVSMDFYLQVPHKSFSRVLRISHDIDIPFEDLKYSLGPVGNAYPVLHFRFNREDDSKIRIAVRVGVKVHTPFGGDLNLDDLSHTLVNRETIQGRTCSRIIPDTSLVPPKNFTIGECHPMTFVPLTTIKPPTYDKSETLNKACDTISNVCGHGEFCDTSDHKCQCLPEFISSSNNDGCLSSSRLNQDCRQDDDCGYGEYCKASNPTDKHTCQCFDGYSFDPVRGICTVGKTGGHTAAPVITTPKPSHTDKPTPTKVSSTTPKSDKQNNDKSKDDTKNANHNLPIYIGVGFAAALVLGLVIFGVMCFLRRRGRRLQLSVDSEASAPMLGNDDSDNMIM